MPEFAAVSAALKGNPEMEAIQHEMLDSFTNVMAAALAPHSGLRPKRSGCAASACWVLPTRSPPR